MDELSIADVHHALQIWYDVSLTDPRIQIAGVCLLFDLSNVHRDSVIKMFESKVGKSITRYYQVSVYCNFNVEFYLYARSAIHLE